MQIFLSLPEKVDILCVYSAAQKSETTSWKENIIRVRLADMFLAHQQVIHQSKEDVLEIQISYHWYETGWPSLVARQPKEKSHVFRKCQFNHEA